MRKHLFPVLLLANTLWSCLFAQTPIVMDMVHHNPGEPFTNTWFNEPGNLVQYGFNAQVVNEFQSVHTAITYSSLDREYVLPVLKNVYGSILLPPV